MAVPPVKNNDYVLSLSGIGTESVTKYRNRSGSGWCRLATAELGYGLLALAAAVETVFRAAVTVVLAALCVVTAPFLACRSEEWTDILDTNENELLLFTVIAGYTTGVNANQVFVNLVALVQNPRKGGEKLKPVNLTFGALFNCCVSDKAPAPEAKAEEKAPVELASDTELDEVGS